MDLAQELPKLEAYADDKTVLEEWAQVKRSNKERLSNYINQELNIQVNPDAMFDVQVKRIHEYKRQHLNILHILGRYLDIKQGRVSHHQPRCYIFGGKAAPGYHTVSYTHLTLPTTPYV